MLGKAVHSRDSSMPGRLQVTPFTSSVFKAPSCFYSRGLWYAAPASHGPSNTPLVYDSSRCRFIRQVCCPRNYASSGPPHDYDCHSHLEDRWDGNIPNINETPNTTYLVFFFFIPFPLGLDFFDCNYR